MTYSAIGSNHTVETAREAVFVAYRRQTKSRICAVIAVAMGVFVWGTAFTPWCGLTSYVCACLCVIAPCWVLHRGSITNVTGDRYRFTKWPFVASGAISVIGWTATMMSHPLAAMIALIVSMASLAGILGLVYLRAGHEAEYARFERNKAEVRERNGEMGQMEGLALLAPYTRTSPAASGGLKRMFGKGENRQPTTTGTTAPGKRPPPDRTAYAKEARPQLHLCAMVGENEFAFDPKKQSLLSFLNEHNRSKVTILMALDTLIELASADRELILHARHEKTIPASAEPAAKFKAFIPTIEYIA